MKIEVSLCNGDALKLVRKLKEAGLIEIPFSQETEATREDNPLLQERKN